MRRNIGLTQKDNIALLILDIDFMVLPSIGESFPAGNKHQGDAAEGAVRLHKSRRIIEICYVDKRTENLIAIGKPILLYIL